VASPDLLMVGNARTYHSIDWYRTIRRLYPTKRIVFVTDKIQSEGHIKMVDGSDDIVDLFNIDRLLLRRQGAAAHRWRHLVMFLLIPVQVARLRALRRRWPEPDVHAHAMYYMILCYLSGIEFIATPVGSEVLLRPDRSAAYRWFARRALRAARVVLVDSVAMQRKVRELSGKEAGVVQYGVPVAEIRASISADAPREEVLSLRGLTRLYRIHEIMEARWASRSQPLLTFTYPFWDPIYRETIRDQMKPGDRDLGRVPMDQLYSIYARALLAISIPSSDSSPRSVYAAIFAGCCVAVTPNEWIDSLPPCMRERLAIVDLANPAWLDEALEKARALAGQPYLPTPEALKNYDQEESLRKIARELYDLGPKAPVAAP
jgi:hypothetical protein